jgi:hypothetical protein
VRAALPVLLLSQRIVDVLMNNVTNMGCMMVLLRFSRFTPRRVGEPADGLAGLGRAGSPPFSPVRN